MNTKEQNQFPQFGLCLNNEGYTASLEVGKVYRVIPDDEAVVHGYIRVIDESGETYAYTVIIDFLINHDIWLEVTLNEEKAYKKTFKYAHQCKQLIVLYLEKSSFVDQKNMFPNAKIMLVDEYFSTDSLSLYKTHIHNLRKYKGIIP